MDAEQRRLQDEQRDYWNGTGGQHWAASEAMTERVLAPVAEAALHAAAPRPGERVVDIGCGCGGTTLRLAAAVGPAGEGEAPRVLGLDISAPMLARAEAGLKERPEHPAIRFLQGDAARYGFDGEADLLFSCLGVMFFADPLVAFTNLRQALKPGGRLVFACWRSPGENPWMMAPLNAACRHVPRPPRPAPGEPGPFSLAAAETVQALLHGAGFTDIGIEPVDVVLDLGGGQGIEAAIDYVKAVGATSRALDNAPPAAQAAGIAAVEALLRETERDGRIDYAGAIWIVSARKR